ncbi:MAG: cyoB, partial [Verrucomicrobiales bacterium]|nr:cyoB [Verrucomicrobiales bacterium]
MESNRMRSDFGAKDAHPKLDFLRTYVFSTDHKIIGLQYGITALLFLLGGFFLMMLMRWQLAYPTKPIPVFGSLLAKTFGKFASNGVVSPELYYSFATMHGTIMVFLGVVPLGFAAFGNYLGPLQIGAPDMALPRVNMLSYQAYFIGGVILL